ncbi:MAG TPA: YqhA family protein [Methanosarcina sp.]|jgi:uncharacterized membrane protein YqhA
MKVVKFIVGMRFLLLIPVIGLAVAACALCVKGGIGIAHFMGELIAGML